MKKIINSSIYIVLIILPIIDIITSFCVRYKYYISPGIIIRGFLLIYMLIYTIFSKDLDIKCKKRIICYYILLVLFFETFILIRLNTNNLISLLMNEIKTLIKIWYFPLTLIFFCNYKFNKKKLLSSLKLSNILYIIGFLLPIILGVSFNSYNFDYKGYSGWFYSANEISSLLSINLIISYIYLNNKYNLLNISIIILNVISLSLIGTKTSLFSIIIITMFCSIIFTFKKGIKSKKTITSFLIILISISIILLNRTSYDVLNRLNMNDMPVFNEYNKSNYIIERFLSGRNINLLKTYDDYKNESLLIKLFGIGFTNNNKLNSIEMDIFDILLRYGLIGTIIYLTPLVYYLIKFIKKRKYIINDLFCLLTIILSLIISFICGHTVTAPMVSTYISICFSLIKKD